MNRDDFKAIEKLFGKSVDDFRSTVEECLGDDIYEFASQLAGFIRKSPENREAMRMIFTDESLQAVEVMVNTAALMVQIDEFSAVTERKRIAKEEKGVTITRSTEPPKGRESDDFGNIANVPKKSHRNVTPMTHEQACNYAKDKMHNWGGFAKQTTPQAIAELERGLEKWFEEEKENFAKIKELDRFNCGYKGVEYANKLTSIDLNKCGFGDTEGGTAVTYYVEARLGRVKK